MTARSPNYVTIWFWLLVLMGVSLAATAVPVARGLAVALVFGAAIAKALLVALNYMHLRFEGRLIVALATVPLLVVAVLGVALFPDFVLGR
ncbi:MAG TPA: cytochrome C oxidase subunit IV family protein [Calidithermus sp.]|nr:cytochrome C oxidase subunit IV family protein [Calidithermus sp.]